MTLLRLNTTGRLLRDAAGVLLACSLLGAATQIHYEMNIAANRPPCEGASDPSARCRGTRGERSSYDITLDTMLWFDQTQPAPVAFVFIGPLAVEPFASSSPALGIGVHAGANGGLFVEAIYGVQRMVQSIELDRWTQIHVPPHTSFWIQVTPSR